MVRGSYNLGYMHEFGLGVPLDYAKALMFYDRARGSFPSAVADVDQNLNGMPIQLLVSIVKARYIHLSILSALVVDDTVVGTCRLL